MTPDQMMTKMNAMLQLHRFMTAIHHAAAMKHWDEIDAAREARKAARKAARG